MPGSDVWFEGGEICAHFGIRFRDWHAMDEREEAEYRAWWREKNLREGLSHKVQKEVGEIIARRHKQSESGSKRGGFIRSMFGGKA